MKGLIRKTKVRRVRASIRKSTGSQKTRRPTWDTADPQPILPGPRLVRGSSHKRAASGCCPPSLMRWQPPSVRITAVVRKSCAAHSASRPLSGPPPRRPPRRSARRGTARAGDAGAGQGPRGFFPLRPFRSRSPPLELPGRGSWSWPTRREMHTHGDSSPFPWGRDCSRNNQETGPIVAGAWSLSCNAALSNASKSGPSQSSLASAHLAVTHHLVDRAIPIPIPVRPSLSTTSRLLRLLLLPSPRPFFVEPRRKGPSSAWPHQVARHYSASHLPLRLGPNPDFHCLLEPVRRLVLPQCRRVGPSRPPLSPHVNRALPDDSSSTSQRMRSSGANKRKRKMKEIVSLLGIPPYPAGSATSPCRAQFTKETDKKAGSVAVACVFVNS